MGIIKKTRPSKMEVYPNGPLDKEMLSLIAGDVALLEDTTKSAAILEPFRARHLPRTENGQGYVKLMVSQHGVKSALVQICATLAGGINWRPRYSNGLEVLEYIDDVCLAHRIWIDLRPITALEMLSGMDSIVGVVEEAADGKRGTYSPGAAAQIAREARYGRRLYKQYEMTSEMAGKDATEPAANLTRYIRGNWGVLASQQVVWRCLQAALAVSDGWPDVIEQGGEVMHVANLDAAKLRTDTIRLIDTVTAEWEVEDASRRSNA